MAADRDRLDALSAESVRAGLGTSLIGQRLVYLPATGSTNDEATRLARAAAVEGTVVLTDYQATGRGRLQRRWEAPPGSSLLLSLLFRPPLPPHQVQQLTMVCGLAVATAVEKETGLQVSLKWPNDVVLGGAKVGGILTEIEVMGGRVDYAVVGVGLNVNLDPAELPRDLLVPATSLSHELGRPVPRLLLLRTFLQAVEERYLSLLAGHSPHKDWAKQLDTLGRPVTVSGSRGVLEGLAEGVDARGALLIRLADGRLETVLAGDVSLRFGKRHSHLL